MGGPPKDDKLSFWRWSIQKKKKANIKGEEVRMDSEKKGLTSTSSKSAKDLGPMHKGSGLQKPTKKMSKKSGGGGSCVRGEDDEEVLIGTSYSPGNAYLELMKYSNCIQLYIQSLHICTYVMDHALDCEALKSFCNNLQIESL